MNWHRSPAEYSGKVATAMMRFSLILIVMAFGASLAKAGEQTLLGKDGYQHGGMGAWRLGAGHFAGKTIVFSGYQGQLIINHKFGIGIAGENFQFEFPIDVSIDGEEYGITVTTTGLDLEMFCSAEKLVHPVCGVTVGGGSLDCRHKAEDWTESELFFVTEPRIGIEMNVARWMRISGVATWRFASGVDTELFDNADLGGWTALVAMKFGSF